MRGLIRLVHRRVLGFDLGPAGSPEHVIGWQILRNRPEALRIEAESELVRGVIVALRPSPHEVTLQTFLFHRRPARARQVWAFVGPLHRSIAPLLLSRAAGHRSRWGGTSG